MDFLRYLLGAWRDSLLRPLHRLRAHWQRLGAVGLFLTGLFATLAAVLASFILFVRAVLMAPHVWWSSVALVLGVGAACWCNLDLLRQLLERLHKLTEPGTALGLALWSWLFVGVEALGLAIAPQHPLSVAAFGLGICLSLWFARWLRRQWAGYRAQQGPPAAPEEEKQPIQEIPVQF